MSASTAEMAMCPHRRPSPTVCPHCLFPNGMALPRLYHRAAKTDGHGNVSALCYARPRAINLARESWTIVDSAVTCPKCLAILSEAPK